MSENIPALDKMKAFLMKSGYPLDGKFGSCRHTCGFPQAAFVMVRPEWSPIDGARVILVTFDTVYDCVCPYPSDHHNWKARGTYSYRIPEELTKILDRLVYQEEGCWA